MNLNHLTPTLFGRNFTPILSSFHRSVRLRLSHEHGVADDLLLVKHVSGNESICGGIDYRVQCVCLDPLPTKQLIGCPIELQFDTSGEAPRFVCGIITSVVEGLSQDRLYSFQLTMQDALAVMDKCCKTRVFRDASETDITNIIIAEWRHKNPVLAGAFNFNPCRLTEPRPPHEFTLQHNESDSAFLRRLWKRRGIGWFIQPGVGTGYSPGYGPTAATSPATRIGSADKAKHILMLFDDARNLSQNDAESVLYHIGPERSDCIRSWHAVRTLSTGAMNRRSWDADQSRMREHDERSRHDQGPMGNQFAWSMEDNLVDPPQTGIDHVDYHQLGAARMQRHEYEARSYQGESDVPELAIGQWIKIVGHPRFDQTFPCDRETSPLRCKYVMTELRVEASSNLPKGIAANAQWLFAQNGWPSDQDGRRAQAKKGTAPNVGPDASAFYTNHFTCIQYGTPIRPSYDPRIDLPRMEAQSVIVVGVENDEVHCDHRGRVKVRFPGCLPQDHAHAKGAGASGTERDSGWVRVSSSWAGAGMGAMSLPRTGDECIVTFLGGDPDQPVITGRVHGAWTPAPCFSYQGMLPASRYLSGIMSREIKGQRSNQLRFNDSPGKISAQVASEHGSSQLNLGYLTHPPRYRDGLCHGPARGEGAELRSDAYLALRAAKGILLSAWQRLNAVDSQLARAEYLSLMEQCLEQFRSLGNYAAKHQALPVDEHPQAQLQASLAQWEHGSNMAGNSAPKAVPNTAAAGGAAVIGVSAPDGISFATPKTIVSYAGGNVDSVAQQHLQFTAGQTFNLNAGKGISLFAHNDGIKAIAHHGTFLMQSQQDDTRIESAKNVSLKAGAGKIVLAGVEIELIAEDGSFIRIGKGVTFGSKGNLKLEVAGVHVTGPATMQAELPGFDAAGAQAARQLGVEFANAEGHAPAGEPMALHLHVEQQPRTSNLAAGKSMLPDVPHGSFTLRQPTRRD